MTLQEITAAIDARNTASIRQAFRALVDFPNEGPVAIGSAGLLAVALNRIGAALADDNDVMPGSTCAALDVPAGSTYAQGAKAAYLQAPKLARRFADGLDLLAGRIGVAAGRAS